MQEMNSIPHHFNGFFRTFVGANAAAFAEFKINLDIIVNCIIRAVHLAETTLVTFLFIYDRFKDSP